MTPEEAREAFRIALEDLAAAHAEFSALLRLDHPLNVEALEVSVAAARAKLPPRSRRKLAWKRGVNPRVYAPFLPYGYEEREGLDYFGNDLRAKQEKGA